MSKQPAGKPKTTSAKFVGQRRFIDADTGEVFDSHYVIKEASDAGFKKIWLGHILAAVEEVGNAKMRVLIKLLDMADSNNMLLGTHAEIAQRTGVGEATVKRLMAALVRCNVISAPRRSQWRLNPDVVFRGGHGRRMNVLISYRDEKQAELPLEGGGAEITSIKTAKRKAA